MKNLDMHSRLQRLRERHIEGDIGRREFLGLLGCAAAAVGVSSTTLLASMRDAEAAVTQLRFDGWGGIVSEAFRKYAFDPYTAKTGIKVVDGTFGSEEEHLTNVRASQAGEYNIHLSSGVTKYKQFTDAGYGVVLNEANIPNLKLVMEALIQPFRRITPQGLSCAPFDYGTSGLAYNTKYISREDMEREGANILLSKEFKGKIGGYGDWQTRVWFGALQSGQDPNDVKDIEAVWAKVREHRGLVRKYFSSGAELMDLLAKEEYLVTDSWSGRIAGLQEQGHPIGYYDPPGAFAWMEDLFVMKGSPLPETEALLNFMLDPATAIAVAQGQNYPPSLDPTKVPMPDDVKALPAFDGTGKLSKLTFANPDFWTAHDADWKKQWGRIEKGA